VSVIADGFSASNGVNSKRVVPTLNPRGSVACDASHARCSAVFVNVKFVEAISATLAPFTLAGNRKKEFFAHGLADFINGAGGDFCIKTVDSTVNSGTLRPIVQEFSRGNFKKRTSL
jgi:hypothetical protein